MKAESSGEMAGARGLAAVEAYLARVPEPGRSALEHLRSVISAAAPGAEEYITYGMPGFRLDGGLVSYAAFKAHLSFFPMSATLIDTLGDELAGFRTSKVPSSSPPSSRFPTRWCAGSSWPGWRRMPNGRGRSRGAVEPAP
jgi:uncharacterized protein YdhG (YjbR/CyaY superfamily)